MINKLSWAEGMTLEGKKPKIQPPEKVSIKMDVHEKPTGINDILESSYVTVEVLPLVAGDYILSDRCCVERKAGDDLANSIMGGRLFEQLIKMLDAYSRPLLIIEGDIVYSGIKMIA